MAEARAPSRIDRVLGITAGLTSSSRSSRPNRKFRIRIAVDGMDVTVGTSLVVLGIDGVMAVADRLNRPLGWTRESWAGFAAGRL